MDIKQRYKYFLARLDHEIKKRGHGAKAEIGGAIDKSGAYIGQLLNTKLNKKAADDTQIAIAEFCCGSEERFIEEGKQLVELGCILSEIPQIQIPIIYKSQAPPPATINFQDEADKKHQIVIAEFRNKDLAIEMNQALVEIEAFDNDEFDEIYQMIISKRDKIRKKRGLPLQMQKNGTSNQQS